MIEAKVDVKDFRRQLRWLELRMEKKVARAAVREGIKVFRTSVKEASPVRTGALKKSVRFKALRTRRGSKSVGARVSFRIRDRKDPYYYFFVIRGSQDPGR